MKLDTALKLIAILASVGLILVVCCGCSTDLTHKRVAASVEHVGINIGTPPICGYMIGVNIGYSKVKYASQPTQ